jgi:6-phospho-3-hexuloisomerase
MRLTQLGLPVFLVSHPTTPALEKNDLLVLISGSGSTASILLAAERAQQLGVETFLITQQEDSQLGRKIHSKLIIQSSPEDDRVLNGTLFEMALLVTLDAVINQLLEITGRSFEDMSARHANLE